MRFIEIQNITGNFMSININHIESISDNKIFTSSQGDTWYTTKHTYEELKQKLKDVDCEIR